jgi:hypothetical protein
MHAMCLLVDPDPVRATMIDCQRPLVCWLNVAAHSRIRIGVNPAPSGLDYLLTA